MLYRKVLTASAARPNARWTERETVEVVGPVLLACDSLALVSATGAGGRWKGKRGYKQREYKTEWLWGGRWARLYAALWQQKPWWRAGPHWEVGVPWRNLVRGPGLLKACCCVLMGEAIRILCGKTTVVTGQAIFGPCGLCSAWVVCCKTVNGMRWDCWVYIYLLPLIAECSPLVLIIWTCSSRTLLIKHH